MVARKKLKYGPFNGGFIGNVKENKPVNGPQFTAHSGHTQYNLPITEVQDGRWILLNQSVELLYIQNSNLLTFSFTLWRIIVERM